jgi:hypothetical protein
VFKLALHANIIKFTQFDRLKDDKFKCLPTLNIRVVADLNALTFRIARYLIKYKTV